VVEQALGDAGGGGDFLDRDLVVGSSAEQLGTGGEQLLAPRIGAQAGPLCGVHAVEASCN
jgi:hypothetical protein